MREERAVGGMPDQGAWEELSRVVQAELAAWRAAHPRATLAEIEAAVGGGDAAAPGAVPARPGGGQPGRRPGRRAPGRPAGCPALRRPAGAARAGRPGGADAGAGRSRSRIRRSYAVCAACGAGPFPPWMRSWGCCRGALSPTLAEGVTRLAAWMPFARAAEQLAFFWRRAPERGDGAAAHRGGRGGLRGGADGGGRAAGARGAAAAARPAGAAAERRRGDGPAGRRAVGRGQDAGHRHGRRAGVGRAGRRVGRADHRPVLLLPAGRRGHLHPAGAGRDPAARDRDGRGGRARWPTGPRGSRASSTTTARTRCASSTSRTPSSTWRPPPRPTFGAGTAAAQAWLAAQAHDLKHGDPAAVLAALPRPADRRRRPTRRRPPAPGPRRSPT